MLPTEFEKYKMNKKEARIYRGIRFTLSSHPAHTKKIKCAYVRYADDGVLLSNAKRERIEEAKADFSKFLKEKLGLS